MYTISVDYTENKDEYERYNININGVGKNYIKTYN